MQKLLPLIALVLAPVLGGAGGFALKTWLGGMPHGESRAEPATAPDAGEKDAHAKPSGAEPKKQAKHGKDKGESAGAAYLKFGRQFVTPVMRGGAPRALVILDIQIETAPETSESAYALEPKIRDAFLQVMMREAAQGALGDIGADPEAFAVLKAELLAAARSVAGDGARDILITDFAVQPL